MTRKSLGTLAMLGLAPIALLACGKEAEDRAAAEGPVGADAAAPPPPVEDAGQADSRATADDGLNAVWGTSPTDVWIAGAAGTILHFDGEVWAESPSGTDHDLHALHGSGPDDVWAVGRDAILHFNGIDWAPVMFDMSELLLGVWSAGTDDVWLAGIATDVGRGVLRRWDGTEWGVATLASSTSFWEIFGIDGEIWSGGARQGGDGYMLHHDGTAFDVDPYSGGAIRGIWGTARDDVWAAPYEGSFHHWDGATWTAADIPGSGHRVVNLGGTAPEDVWAVGLDGLIVHWDGSAWSIVDAGTDVLLSAVWAAAPDDAWIAGGDGTILHYDGDAWSPVAIASP